MTTTTFEEIIDNPRIFKMILDEVLHDWPGSYDIMPVESPQDRTIKEHNNKFADFCKKVRESQDGLQRCLNCDLEFSQKAAKDGKPLYYACHAGLMEIAVPIMIREKLIATIFCGQHRSEDDKTEKKAIQKTIQAEIDLGFNPGELLQLRERTHTLSYDKIKDIQEKLWEVATYVSRLGSSKLDAEKAKKELAYRLFETESIQKILLELSGALYEVETFWKKLDSALDRICEIIGASFALFIICEEKLDEERVIGKVKSASSIPRLISNFGSSSCSPRISTAITEMQLIIVEIDGEHAFTDFLDKFKEQFPEKNNIDKIAIIPVRLDPENLGAMVLFLSKAKDVNNSLELKDELALLAQTANQIGTVYGKCVLYEKQKELADIQSEWLENVSHQILAPISGILGQTQNLSNNFRTWQKISPYKIDNALITLSQLAEWTSRMAKNFAWVASEQKHPREPSLRLEDDVPGRLIGYARDVQGFAKTSDITSVHVDDESLMKLNNKIAIDSKLFKQAVTNLLDNAVKYANSKTEILIAGRLSSRNAHIDITNYGIPLRDYELEKIFQRYYRTDAAKQKYVIGSGIGLVIARDIMRLHGGDLLASPSILVEIGWKTTFTIILPLK